MTSTGYLPGSTGVGGLDGERARLAQQARLTGPQECAMLRDALGADPACVVEIGCGTGEFITELRRAFPAARVLGADPDAALVAHCPPGCSVLDEEWVDSHEGQADLVVARFVAQHLGDAERAELIARARRLLRPEGLVAIIDVDDADFGSVHPFVPQVADVYRRLAQWRAADDGRRDVLPVVLDELTREGWDEPTRRRGVFACPPERTRELSIHLGPERLAGYVARGALSVSDLAVVTAAWQVFITHPDRRADLALHAVTARCPHTEGDTQ